MFLNSCVVSSVCVYFCQTCFLSISTEMTLATLHSPSPKSKKQSTSIRVVKVLCLYCLFWLRKMVINLVRSLHVWERRSHLYFRLSRSLHSLLQLIVFSSVSISPLSLCLFLPNSFCFGSLYVSIYFLNGFLFSIFFLSPFWFFKVSYHSVFLIFFLFISFARNLWIIKSVTRLLLLRTMEGFRIIAFIAFGFNHTLL